MKVAAFVPLKLNNERLPNKNIMAFDNGKPLLDYMLNTLVNISEIDTVFVYCSDKEVVNYLPSGVEYLARSEELDKPSTLINEVIDSFINDVMADIYVLAHVTAPFVKEESIKMGLKKVIEDGYDSAFAVQKLQEFLWQKNKPVNFDPSNIPRTQDLMPYYSETSGFYIFKKEVFTQYKRRIGHNPYLVELSKIESIDIDLKEDFDIANAIYNYFIDEVEYAKSANLRLHTT